MLNWWEGIEKILLARHLLYNANFDLQFLGCHSNRVDQGITAKESILIPTYFSISSPLWEPMHDTGPTKYRISSYYLA